MANRTVVLYQRSKIRKKWAYRKVAEVLSKLSCGEYYVSWYDGSHKRMDPVGRDPDKALAALEKKRLELAYVAVGGEVRQPDKKQIIESAYAAACGEVRQGTESTLNGRERILVSTAVKEYLADCKDRQGKSGYGLAVRTPQTYEDRLAYLTEYRPTAYMDEINDVFIKGFRRFLREHENDLSDRSSYNIMQAVSTFLNKNGNGAAKPFLKEMSFPPTEVIPYPEPDMQK